MVKTDADILFVVIFYFICMEDASPRTKEQIFTVCCVLSASVLSVWRTPLLQLSK